MLNKPFCGQCKENAIGTSLPRFVECLEFERGLETSLSTKSRSFFFFLNISRKHKPLGREVGAGEHRL